MKCGRAVWSSWVMRPRISHSCSTEAGASSLPSPHSHSRQARASPWHRSAWSTCQLSRSPWSSRRSRSWDRTEPVRSSFFESSPALLSVLFGFVHQVAFAGVLVEAGPSPMHHHKGAACQKRPWPSPAKTACGSANGRSSAVRKVARAERVLLDLNLSRSSLVGAQRLDRVVAHLSAFRLRRSRAFRPCRGRFDCVISHSPKFERCRRSLAGSTTHILRHKTA